ncbi:MAG: DUF4405 domain-containing protein [Bacteroidales bacterium]
MRKSFYWRSYVSFGLFLSFLVITISGIILYVAPTGRIARWISWQMFWLSRAQWEDLHTLFSYLFIIFGLFHLFLFNWKLFFSYIRSRLTSGLNRKREMMFALLTFLIVFVLTIVKTPPIYSVMELGNSISATWGEKQGTPPVPNAEGMTLREISNELLRTDPDEVSAYLDKIGYAVKDVDMVFEDISRENGISASDLFKELSRHYEVFLPIRERK